MSQSPEEPSRNPCAPERHSPEPPSNGTMGRGHIAYRLARRIVIGVVGATLALIGIALFVLPGPGTLVLGMGLAILGLEFAWARNWLRKLRDTAGQAASYMNSAMNGVRGNRGRRTASSSPPCDPAPEADDHGAPLESGKPDR